MKIKFTTKEESNREQRENYIKLSPINRIYSFIKQVYIFNNFPLKKNKSTNSNFTITFYDEY